MTNKNLYYRHEYTNLIHLNHKMQSRDKEPKSILTHKDDTRLHTFRKNEDYSHRISIKSIQIR